MTLPTVAGLAQDGERLTGAAGTWTDGQTFAYQWRRCDVAGSCSDIAGATGLGYTVRSWDIGSRLLLAVTATNALGSSLASSDMTAAVAAAPPTNITRNDVSGIARDGELLTTNDGRWTGTQPITYAYQWRRCDVLGNACLEIDGAIAPSYRLTPKDIGFTIRARVIGTNLAGSTNRSSLQTAVVAAIPLVNTALPTISGIARDGEKLTSTPGTWTGSPPTLAYRWQRCDALVITCTDIAGATAPTYTLTAADIGFRLLLVVTAANAAGVVTVGSQPTASAVVGVAPNNITRNEISGTPRDGELLSTNDGRWTGTQPMTYAYQWRRCDSLGDACIEIEGATAPSYRLTAADIGFTIRARVIATNVVGSTNRSSLPTAIVVPTPLVLVAPPTISGSVRDGETLTAGTGSWTGSSPTFAYRWQRCDSVGANCLDVPGADGPSYMLTPADVGFRFLVAVTATSAGVSITARSAETAVVTLLVAFPTVETAPVPMTGDAADDIAIWVDHASPELSTVIGTVKAGTGGIAVYDLTGAQIDYHADGKMNNVDLRDGFVLGGLPVTLVTAGNRSTKAGLMPNGSIAIYRVDPATRRLVNVAARAIQPGIGTYGSCMYRSPTSGKFYYFVNSTIGQVEQWELYDDGLGRVDAAKVRSFALGSITEGCVADDELGYLYIAEENVGIWKYSAEPDGGTSRVLVDGTLPNGRLAADIEGLTLVYRPGGGGYLLASSQGNSSFVVYRREGANAYVRRFEIHEGNGIDAVEEADGIDATAAYLGPAFPNGVFIAHDGLNGTQNQNYKLVPLQDVLRGEP